MENDLTQTETTSLDSTLQDFKVESKRLDGAGKQE